MLKEKKSSSLSLFYKLKPSFDSASQSALIIERDGNNAVRISFNFDTNDLEKDFMLRSIIHYLYQNLELLRFQVKTNPVYEKKNELELDCESSFYSSQDRSVDEMQILKCSMICEPFSDYTLGCLITKENMLYYSSEFIIETIKEILANLAREIESSSKTAFELRESLVDKYFNMINDYVDW